VNNAIRATERNDNTRLNILTKIFTLLIALLGTAGAMASAATVEEKRQNIREATQETLNEVYSVQSKARDAVANADRSADFADSGWEFGGQGWLPLQTV